MQLSRVVQRGPAHSFLLISFRGVPRQPRNGNQHSGWLATCTRVVGVLGRVVAAAGADCGGLKWKLLCAIRHAWLASGTVRGNVLQKDVVLMVVFQGGGVGVMGLQEGMNVAQEHLRAQLRRSWRKEKNKTATDKQVGQTDTQVYKVFM